MIRDGGPVEGGWPIERLIGWRIGLVDLGKGLKLEMKAFDEAF